MHYAILAFDTEEAQLKFMRRFEQYQLLREQMCARAATTAELTEDEEKEMWGNGAA